MKREHPAIPAEFLYCTMLLFIILLLICVMIINYSEEEWTLSDSKGFSKILVYCVKREHREGVCDTGCRSEEDTEQT